MSEKTTYEKFKRYYQDFCGLLLFLAVTLSMAEIVCRVLFGISYDLFFSFTVWITLFALLLITGLMLPEGGHVSIDFIRLKLRGQARRVLEAILALLTLAFSSLITYSAVLFLQQLHRRGSAFPLQIYVPMWLVELCVPLGMG
ncbi:MAG: TRAP transporter small permease, partial [Thermodesulfobacteriota bacterium]